MAVHYLEESRSTTDIKKRKIEGKESIDKMFLSIKNEEFRVSESGTVINGRSGLVTPSKSNDEKVREISGSEMDLRWTPEKTNVHVDIFMGQVKVDIMI